mmetsp:Transcript_28968/g.59373  ORF Transcript_28968/g.59373 Transcript_28968/m.59373 type:complete len:210 (-) Transcript_28968:669-1298(-)
MAAARWSSSASEVSAPSSLPYAFNRFAIACTSSAAGDLASTASSTNFSARSSRMPNLASAFTETERWRLWYASGGSCTSTLLMYASRGLWWWSSRAYALRMFATDCAEKSLALIVSATCAIAFNSATSLMRSFASAFTTTDTDCAANSSGTSTAMRHASPPSALNNSSSRIPARANPLRITATAWISKESGSSCASHRALRDAASSSGP